MPLNELTRPAQLRPYRRWYGTDVNESQARAKWKNGHAMTGH